MQNYGQQNNQFQISRRSFCKAVQLVGGIRSRQLDPVT